MAGNVKVVEDGAQAPPDSRSPQGPNWFWVTIGFVIGLGLAIIFFTAGMDEPVEPVETVSTPELDQPSDPDASTNSSPPQEGPEGVSEVVAGFPDTLIAVTQLSGSSLGQLTWPLAGPPRVEDLPGFFTSNADFDFSGRMLAMGAQVPDTGRMLLSVGTARRIQPLASDVTGFAWHDSQGGRLAYTQVVAGDEWRLSVVDTSRLPDLIAKSPDMDGRVAAWGDWGFAVQEESQVTLLSPTGEPLDVLKGRVLDSDEEGRIVLYDGDLRLMEVSGPGDQLEVDLSGIGEPEDAAISPDGSKLAVVGGAGHLIVPLDGEGETIYAPVTSGFPQLAWSSDSRFLISPWIRGVLFIDTERSTAQPLAELTSHTVVAVAAVPLGGD